MTRYIYITSLLVSMLFFSTSCMKENSPASNIESGENVSLSLDMVLGGMKTVHVKATDDFEDNVRDLRVYIFSASDGKLIGYKYYGATEFTDAGTSYDAALSPVSTKTGSAYIYGIANSETNMVSVKDLDGAKTVLNIDELNVESSELTRDDFLKLTYVRTSQAIKISDNRYCMSGSVNGGNAVKIVSDNTLTNGANARIETDGDSRLRLYKTVAKNKVTVSCKDPSDAEIDKNVKFTPDYYEIYNVPQSAGLLPENIVKSGNGSYVIPGDFELVERQVLSTSTFEFYLPENCQSRNLADDQKTAIGSVWKNREKKNENASSFVNAPEQSTYILISGRYESDNYSGSVVYSIHLGDFSKDKSDFDVCRNYSYIYNMTVSGVQNFIVEASREGDDPGSEGIVINSHSGTVFNVDCHYEARAMSFSKTDIKTLIADHFGYIIKVKTPFCESKSLIVDGDGKIYEATDYKRKLDDNQTPVVLATVAEDGSIDNPGNLVLSGDPDFLWIHFVRNTGVYSTNAVNNPGCMVASNRGISDVCKYPGTAQTKNVFQFFKELYEKALSSDTDYSFFDAAGNVHVSCFVDENYYPDKKWSEFVNKTDGRSIYFASKFKDSSDGKSFYAEAKYAVIQNSIWTFYDAATLPADKYPFGLESVSEDKSLNKGRTYAYNGETDYPNYDITLSSYGDDWNGYTAATKYQTNHSFYSNNYRAVENSVNTQDQYSKISYVCMGRNRDENGNGVIDKEEIKWYLATVDQYKGIWAGEDILSADVKLVPDTDWLAKLKNGTAPETYHYFALAASANEAIFWAEEGASTSPLKASWSDANKVRCIRTLADNDEGRKDPSEYFTTKSVTDGTEIDLYIKPMREPWKNAVGSSFERDYGTTSTKNVVYNKFIVNTSSAGLTTVTDVKPVSYDMTDQTDVCVTKVGSQWRVPNQKELSIMTAALTDKVLFGSTGSGRYMWCATAFSGAESGEFKSSANGYGFGYLEGSHMSIGFNRRSTNTETYTTYIRCVRDVVE